MVPFYGQGLNCGLEDVRILDSILQRFDVSSTTPKIANGVDKPLADALAHYSSSRHEDLVAICELAMNN